MRQPRQGLLGGVRVNRAHAAEMSRVQRLEQVECLRTAYLPDQDAIGPVTECRAHQIRNRDRRQWLLLSQGYLCAARLEAQQVRLLQMNLRRLLDHDDAIAVWNVRGEGIQERRLAGAGAARNQDVV